ncbi:MAG: DUF3330 domain-containing protein [Burkholderiales bacterium]
MNTPSVSPAGAKIAVCADEERCEVVSCVLCLAEIPLSAAKSLENAEYVQHFCGLDCLAQWQNLAEQADTK